MIQARVKDMPLGVCCTCERRDPELDVPLSLQFVPLGFEIPRLQLGVEVGACLLETDKGGAHLHLDYRARFRIELRKGSDGLAGHFGSVRHRQNALVDALCAERLSKTRDEIPLEVWQSEAA